MCFNLRLEAGIYYFEKEEELVLDLWVILDLITHVFEGQFLQALSVFGAFSVKDERKAQVVDWQRLVGVSVWEQARADGVEVEHQVC